MDDSRRRPVSASTIERRLEDAGLPPLPRLAWLEVDLDVVTANARALGRLLPGGTLLGAVVKADGYGHGLVAAARAALRGGAAVLLVATLDEGLLLRQSGVQARIIVLYPLPPGTFSSATAHDLDVVIGDDAGTADLASHLRAAHTAPRVHLAIDTGMGRGGIGPDRAIVAARTLLEAGLPGLAGIWSHLATPEDPAAVRAQVERFEETLTALARAGIDPGLRHLDATGGLLGRVAPAYDLVRVGLALYGVLPPELPLPREVLAPAGALRPAMTLRGRATTIATVSAGSAVGYGGTWVAPRRTVVATVPVGYADGWARAYAAHAWGVVRGRRAPLIGRVSSDALALDVTDVPSFGPADEVVLLGEPPAMTVHDLAALRGSISWEVLDSFSPRLPRVYTESGRIVGVRYLDGRTRLTRAFTRGRSSGGSVPHHARRSVPHPPG